MQIEQLLFDPYKFEQGGDIGGDYNFKKGTKVSMQDDADIELQAEEARLQMRTDENNYLCFREGETFINLDLEVGGSIRATALDVDRLDIGEDIHAKGNVTVDGDTTLQTITTHQAATFLQTLNAGSVHTSTLTGINSLTLHTLNAKYINLVGDTLVYPGTITLDASTGHIYCNGGIVCSNNNPLTNLENPMGVQTDFIETGVHRSDFGKNANNESIAADGKISAGEFYTDGSLHCVGLHATSISTDTVTTHDLTVGTAGVGVVDFTDIEKIDFTGLAPEDIVGWPFASLHNIIDTNNGIAIKSDATHQHPGTLTSGAVISEHATHKDLLLGLNGAGTVDFTQLGTLDFTGLLASQIVNWPLANPDCLANIQDTATGVQIDGDIKVNVLKPIDPNVDSRLQLSDYYDVQVHDLLVESILPSPQLPDGILRINGFDQVRISDELNVQGRAILTNTTITGTLDAHAATFDSDVGIDGTLDAAKVITDSVGQSDDLRTKYFDGPGLPYIGHIIGPGVVGMFRQTQIDFLVPVFAPNIDSSGSFTHCHVCEPETQNLDWANLTGRLIESTGNCAVRDGDGNLVTDFTQAPSLNHAMTSVRLAETTCLGILNSVELVENNEINHAHGITLKHKVSEVDGHKILRVCGSGDTYVWTVKPIANETLLTPSILSGLFTKYVNGVEQTEKVVLTVHEDFSFQMIINIPNIIDRLTLLEQTLDELRNA